MYKYGLSIALLLTTVIANAQTNYKLNIEQATVFLHGAQLTGSTKVHFSKGENEIIFTNVAGDINTQSLTVNAGPGVAVESAVFSNDYLATEVLSPKAKEIKDSIEILTDERTLTANKIAVLNEQVAALQTNKKVGGENSGLSVAELTKLLDLIGSKMEGYLNQKHKLDGVLKKTDERIALLRKQLEEENKKGFQPGGQIRIKVFAKDAVTNPVVVSYVLNNAGWSPSYDLRVDDISKPASLYYKADIYQNSGISWNNVHLTLSTGNPNEGAQAPTPVPWYLSFYEAGVANSGGYNRQNYSMAPVVKAYKKPLVAEDASPSSMNEYVTVDNGGISTQFDIELPYTIPTDGKQHNVAIKKYDLNATYRYFAVPRMDKDAFLQAQITNWEDMNLMPGQTNIFYEGTFVGQGYIDIRNTSDTLTFSLGRDKKVVVKREQDKKKRAVRTIGSNVRETFAYTISVRNTRRDNITLVLEDQLPVSNDKDIVIEDTETGNAEIVENTGMLKWTFNLKPNEVSEARFGYTVKYPKGKQVSGLR
ncbi:MAG: DUF4139 domain-containing protein [Taibaiella sp.]|nr:DUF4139 domain-containing protein [Taibaiella sp.]